MEDVHIFFHPDLGNIHIAVTVGPGVSPGQPFARVADYTASGEFHPALKTSYFVVSAVIIYGNRPQCNPFILELLFYFSLDCI